MTVKQHNSTTDGTYVGRFAPSPTGELHAGSLLAALGSFLQARTRGGQWLVRMEDLDPPREVAGAVTAILHALEAHGLCWDGDVLFQSQRQSAYQDALQQLQEAGLVYRCSCSRKQVASQGRAGAYGVIYAETCRRKPATESVQAYSWRLRTFDDAVEFVDRSDIRMTQKLRQQVGDFVIKRADGLFAYQLAVVVDDAWQGVTEVVRGADLLDNTPRQIYLQRCLGLLRPDYFHLPILVNADGQKLSKQNFASPLNPKQAEANLLQALIFLGQNPDPALQQASLEEILQWAIAHWCPANCGRGPHQFTPLNSRRLSENREPTANPSATIN